MDTLNSSLANLSDIETPAVVPLWPPGEGLWLLLLALWVGGLLVAYLYFKRQRANRYRAAGLQLLQTAVTVHEVSVVLKRVALAAFKRERVASLYGAQWQDFLTSTCPGSRFVGLSGDGERPAGADLLQSAEMWIRNHRVEERGGE